MAALYQNKAMNVCLDYAIGFRLPSMFEFYCPFNSEVQHCQVLSDDKKRALYDQYGEAGVKSAVGGYAYTTNPFDLFETFFGQSMGGFPGMDPTGFGTRRRSTLIKGGDIRYDILLEFSEAIFGAEKEFELSHLEKCEACNGTGAKVGSKMRICSTCSGRGQVMRTEQTPFGLFSQSLKSFLGEEKVKGFINF